MVFPFHLNNSQETKQRIIHQLKTKNKYDLSPNVVLFQWLALFIVNVTNEKNNPSTQKLVLYSLGTFIYHFFSLQIKVFHHVMQKVKWNFTK